VKVWIFKGEVFDKPELEAAAAAPVEGEQAPPTPATPAIPAAPAAPAALEPTSA
jgi:hypothetical protein